MIYISDIQIYMQVAPSLGTRRLQSSAEVSGALLIAPCFRRSIVFGTANQRELVAVQTESFRTAFICSKNFNIDIFDY